jgi:hypothetical protein
MHSIMDPTVGTCAGSIVELTDMDIHLPTEDIHIPTEDPVYTEATEPTEDIPTASDNILVRKNLTERCRNETQWQCRGN